MDAFSLTDARCRGTGIIFISNRFRESTHFTSDTEGRVIAVDIFVDGKRTRIRNVYALVTQSLTNNFFKNLRTYMLEPRQYTILGDFNCDLDTMRDIRGPGQGASNYHAKELRNLLTQNQMSDTWILKHADIFEPTRTSRHAASRLDRIYITQALIQQLENCQVVTLSPELSHISDHKPVSVTIKGNSGRVCFDHAECVYSLSQAE